MRSGRATELWLLDSGRARVAAAVLDAARQRQHARSRSTRSPCRSALVVSFFVAHIALRKFAPNADPALLPIAFLLCGIGICFVLRLSPDTAGQVKLSGCSPASRSWSRPSSSCPSIERIGRWKYTCLLFGLILLHLADPPLHRRRVQRLAHLAVHRRHILPAGRDRKDLDRLVPGCLPGRQPRAALHAQPQQNRHQVPQLPGSAAAARSCGSSPCSSSSSSATSARALLLFGVFLVMLYACTGRVFYVIVGVLLVVVGGTGLLLRVQPRADAHRHLARPLCRPGRFGLPARAVPLLAG